MSDYTPDMEDMHLAWEYQAHVTGITAEEAKAEFDRFMAKVKADALREAAETLVRDAGLIPMPNSDHPAVRALRERAGRLEGEA